MRERERERGGGGEEEREGKREGGEWREKNTGRGGERYVGSAEGEYQVLHTKIRD